LPSLWLYKQMMAYLYFVIKTMSVNCKLAIKLSIDG
jgi:hypothetical protein